MTDQPKRAAVSPMQIIDVKEQPATTGERGEDLSDYIKEEQPLLVCRQGRTDRERTDAALDLGRELRQLRSAVAENLSQLRVIRLFAHPSTKRFNKRQVRGRGFVLVASSTQDDGSIDRGLNHDLSREACFSGARLAAQQEAMAASVSRSTP